MDFSSRPVASVTRKRPWEATSRFSNKLRLEDRPPRPGAWNWKPTVTGVTHVLCCRWPGTAGLNLLSKKASFGSFSGEFLFCNCLKGSLSCLKNFKGSIEKKFSERHPDVSKSCSHCVKQREAVSTQSIPKQRWIFFFNFILFLNFT